jgi:photosystem II stability/assembly factor-like uncharacterized protein
MRIAIAALALVSSLAFASAPKDAFNDLNWRLVGPYRAGWSTVALGVPGEDQSFLFGAAGGGVWKSTDAGNNWFSLTDKVPITSVGALAIAPSDRNVIYVGSGQPQARYDTAHGYGVFASRDAGKTWQNMGLSDTRHISDIIIDQHNPQRVLVAALGPYYAQSAARGVYLSEDGGKRWQQTLKVDARTGIVDLAFDPAQAEIIYAAAWEARNYPWMSYFKPMVGAGSAIYKSLDAGKTWNKLAGVGWPTGALGRIGLAVSGTRVYAIVDHKEQGGLYRSDDGGANWQAVNKNPALTTRYFGRITVAPNDANTVYLMGRSIKVSHDGGANFSFFRGSPGGDDYHDLWINPDDPNKMVAASDQGTIVSLNAGVSWSNWYNQPTGQFYCLHVDNQFPYHLYAGQQDNGSVAITSRSDYGSISFRDWHPVGADERDCDVPDPDDAKIVYGSGLGGRVGRFDARTGDVQNITPVPLNTYGQDPRTIAQRWSWITPLTMSSTPDHALYLGSQQLYRSRDKGQNWNLISEDLTGRTQSGELCSGDIEDEARAKACGFGVIFTIAPSPFDQEEVWVGSDSGLIQRSRDGGKTWQNLTPPQVPLWGKISRIELSALNRNDVYVAVDLHRKNIFAPLLLRSQDAGKSWQVIVNGLPKDQLTSVIRADQKQAGLLFAGTDQSVYVSLDDGAHWQSLGNELPSAWVRDMRMAGDDLAIATQGRGLWILDNIARLRTLAARAQSAPKQMAVAQLFAPATALRLRRNQNKDTPLPPEIPRGKNPPFGAMLEYYLRTDAKQLSLRILDVNGVEVRAWQSSDAPETLVADQYFHDRYLPNAAKLATTQGAHRWLWDLRHQRPMAPSYEYSIGAVEGLRTPALPEGPLALPGEYQVELSVDGKKFRQTLRVELDPRLQLSAAQLQAIFDFNLALRATLAELTAAISASNALLTKLGDAPATSPELLAVQARLTGSADAPGLQPMADALAATASDVESAERAPTAAQLQQLAQFRTRIAQLMLPTSTAQ